MTFAPVLLASGFLLPALACLHTTRTDNGTSNGTFPDIVAGSDKPADSATTGYVMNHFSLNVRNMTRSLEWYSTVFGFRLIFNFKATKKLSIAYMAHSHGGKNGTAYQTVREMNRNKNNMEGLLELIHFDGAPPLVASTVVPNTFSHYGIIVPDISATQARMDKLDILVVKRTGEIGTLEGPIANAYGLGDISKWDPAEVKEISDGFLAPGGQDFIILQDPDGNLIEVQSQYQPQLEL
jgi:lactoylglutathione lyase